MKVLIMMRLLALLLDLRLFIWSFILLFLMVVFLTNQMLKMIFFNGHLTKKVYMTQPLGFAHPPNFPIFCVVSERLFRVLNKLLEHGSIVSVVSYYNRASFVVKPTLPCSFFVVASIFFIFCYMSMI